MILYYSNIISFYVEYKILEFMKLSHYFSFETIDNLQSKMTLFPKKYIILSEDLKILQIFNKLGTWTGLLVTLVLSYSDLSGSYFKLVTNNLEIIKQGFKPNFTATTFFQQKYIFEVIFSLLNEYNNNIANENILEEKLKNKVIVVTAIRTSFKYSDYKKHRFIFSNEKVIFYPHVGGNDISVNKKFQVILNRIIYQQDFLNYKIFLNNMMNYANNNEIL